jgi:hypothetical protein
MALVCATTVSTLPRWPSGTFPLDVRYYREFIADAPEQFGGFPAFQIAPPLPFIPEERHGKTLFLFVACWAGPVDEGARILKPLHDVAEVVAEHVDRCRIRRSTAPSTRSFLRVSSTPGRRTSSRI